MIIGENGTGKSSILEGIYFAFTGEGWRTSKEGLVNMYTEKQAEVSLKFSYNDETYVIRRFIGKQQTDYIAKLDAKNNYIVLARGAKEISKLLEKLLGVNPKTFTMISVIRQGGLTELFEMSPKDRKDFIDKLIGLHRYTNIGEKLQDVKIEVPGVTAPLRPVEGLDDDVQSVLASIRQAYYSKYEDLSRVKNDLESERKKLENLESLIAEKKLREKAAELQELETKEKELREKVSKLEAEKEQLNLRINTLLTKHSFIQTQIEETKRGIDELEVKIKYLEFESVLNQVESIMRELNSLKQLYEEKLASLRRLQNIYNEVKKYREKYGNELADAEKKFSELNSLCEEATTSRNELDGQIRKLTGKMETLTSKLKPIENNLIRLLEDLGLDTREHSYELVKQKYENAQGQLALLRTQLDQITRREGEIENMIRSAKEKIDLMESTLEPVCPLCKRPLSGKDRESLIKTLEEELARHRKEMEDLQREKERLISELRKLEDLVKRLAEIVPRYEDYDNTVRQINELKDVLNKLEKQKVEKDKVVNELCPKRDEMMRDLQGWRSVERLVNEQELKSLETEVEAIDKKIHELQEYILNTLSKTPFAIKASLDDLEQVVTEARRLVNGAREANMQRTSLTSKLESLRVQEEELSREIRQLEEKINEIEKTLSEEKKKLEEISKRVSEAKAAKDELMELEKRIEASKTRVKDLADKADSLKKEIADVEEKARRLWDAYRKAAIVAWLRREVFHRDGLPKVLRKKYIEATKLLVEKMLKGFELGFEQVEINEEYEVAVKRRGATNYQPVNTLSGGESVVVGILLLLAMHQVVTSGKIGFLALDEPTIHLDEERRRKLISTLKEFKGGNKIPQLIVVTHDQDVIEAADTVIRVLKENNISRVEKEYGG